MTICWGYGSILNLCIELISSCCLFSGNNLLCTSQNMKHILSAKWFCKVFKFCEANSFDCQNDIFYR